MGRPRGRWIETSGRTAVLARRVVGHLVLGDVVEDVLERPVRERVALGEAAANRRVLELIDPGALEALPASAPVDHAVGLERLEACAAKTSATRGERGERRYGA